MSNYDKLTLTIVAMGRLAGRRLIEDPTPANIRSAADVMEKLANMVEKQHEAISMVLGTTSATNVTEKKA